MPAYNFQRRFVFPILLGVKPHTIRRRRKYPTEPGDRIMMYTGLRTKRACKFGTSLCIKVEPIIIYPWKLEVLIANEQGVYSWMKDYALEALAQHDGFGCVEEFFYFFQSTYFTDMLDDFEIIHWDPRRIEIIPGVRTFPFSEMMTSFKFGVPLEKNPKYWPPYPPTKLEAVADWEERRMR